MHDPQAFANELLALLKMHNATIAYGHDFPCVTFDGEKAVQYDVYAMDAHMVELRELTEGTIINTL